jgi:hypothetical protein
MIEGLLVLSRNTHGELEYVSLDLSALAGEVVAELRLAEPRRQVEVVIAPGLRAEGDPRLLKNLLRNLLGNAWKYSAERPDARIEFDAREEDGKALFCVSDNGAGFNMSYADRLFQPFQRLHKDGRFEGSGIGLATALRIGRRHGGAIRAEAAPDKGARFCFTLGEEAPVMGAE